MQKWLPELPEDGWRKIALLTGVTTLAVCALAVIGMLVGNALAGEKTSPQDYITTLVLSGFITAPILTYVMIKLQQLHLVNEQLNYLATTDFLTGALNRRAFMAFVEDRLYEDSKAGRNPESALLVIDVDHFKVINDRYGHQTGDIALVRIADTLRANLRSTDLFGRLGGEEFGVYLDDISPIDAVRAAERCRIAINACEFTPEGRDHTLSISVGIALSTAGEDFASLFKQADSRLYLAKEHGRNRIEPPGVFRAA